MTTAWLTLPVIWLPDSIAAAALVGILFAMAAFAILKTGPAGRLLCLLSWPAYSCISFAQWTPLFVAVALLPMLMPLGLAKPQLLIPSFFTYVTWRRAIGLALFGLLTLVPDPTWPLRFLSQLSDYDGYFPLLTLAGPLLILLLVCWHDPDARYLALCAITPQRLFHDLLIIAPVLRTSREAMIWTIATWAIVVAAFILPVSSLISPICYSVAAIFVMRRTRFLEEYQKWNARLIARRS